MSEALHFDAIAFAGGGLRCYWQSGFWSVLKAHGLRPPAEVIGVSAGAYHACLAMADMTEATCAEVIAWYNTSPFQGPDWARLKKAQSPFIVGEIYRDSLLTIFDHAALARLHQAPPVYIQVARPPEMVPASLAALSAIAAYQLEKLITGAAHSKAGRYVGFSADWISTHAITSPPDLVAALMATASVPPFIPVGHVLGRAALDGGLVDNPPIQKLPAIEEAGGQTLVLATRAGRQMASTKSRVVVGPSRPVTVDKFVCHDGRVLQETYDLGRHDGEAFIAQMDQVSA